MDYPDTKPTNEELQGVKDVIASFVIGLKNFTLYPENHAICQKSVANSASRLDGFLKTYGDLRLDVAKDHLLYKTEVVYQESASAENLSTQLFRDGIQHLHFLDGFELNELKIFFEILKKYKIWDEDSDGDLVTALWEADLPNLKYKAVDAHWESEPVLDFTHLNNGKVDNSGDDGPEGKEQGSLSVIVEESQCELWKLTDEETKRLHEMVEEEEKRDTLNDLLFVVFILSKDQKENNALRLALEFLKGEIQAAFARADFRFAFRLLSALSQIQRATEEQKTWARDDLDQFFMKVSGPEVLNMISQGLESSGALDSENNELLKQALLLLRPDAILALGPMLSQSTSPTLQNQILEIIVTMARKDMRPLEKLLEGPDESMVQKLISVFGQLKGKIPIQILLKLLRNSSAAVRKQAIRHLETQDAEVVKKLLYLIEDPDESVRSLVFRKFGSVRSALIEDLLLDYLEKRQFTIKNHQHLLACYRTLGQCGSGHSIPFLRRVLFYRVWFPDLGKSIHRRGAAVALTALGTKEAKEILQKASRSLFPSVRLACRSSLEVSQ